MNSYKQKYVYTITSHARKIFCGCLQNRITLVSTLKISGLVSTGKNLWKLLTLDLIHSPLVSFHILKIAVKIIQDANKTTDNNFCTPFKNFHLKRCSLKMGTSQATRKEITLCVPHLEKGTLSDKISADNVECVQ